MTRDQIVYLAGIMDGEGTFHIGHHNKNSRSLTSRLYVVNTDVRLINWLHENFGGLIYTRTSIKNPHWKKKFEWVVNVSQIIPITEAILPFLIVKKEQAELMIKFRKTFDQSKPNGKRISDEILSIRLDCLSEMRKLNHRSNPI